MVTLLKSSLSMQVVGGRLAFVILAMHVVLATG